MPVLLGPCLHPAPMSDPYRSRRKEREPQPPHQPGGNPAGLKKTAPLVVARQEDPYTPGEWIPLGVGVAQRLDRKTDDLRKSANL